MDYELTYPKKVMAKAPTKTKIAVKDGNKEEQKMQKQNYKKTRKLHRLAIRKLRADIKRHKLLMKQARLTYKLSK